MLRLFTAQPYENIITEEDVVAVMPQTCSSDVGLPGLNLGVAVLTEEFRDFPQSE
jgi:hypothetical protein